MSLRQSEDGVSAARPIVFSLQSPEGDWCRCDPSLLVALGRAAAVPVRVAIPRRGLVSLRHQAVAALRAFDAALSLQSPEGDWCRCDLMDTQ